MAGGRTFLIRLLGDTKGIEAAFGKTAGKMAQFAAKTAVVGAAMGAVFRGFKAVTEETIRFEKTLMNLTTQIGLSQEAADAIGDSLLNMTDLLVGPQELADAFYFVASAGLEGAAAMETVQASAKAAAIGLGETQVVADLLTSVLSAYGTENITAAEATDTLLKAVRDGKAEASDMATSMGQVIPIAASMGLRFEDVSASLAILTRNGVAAAEGTTQLRSFLVGLLQPSAEAADAMAKYGLNAAQIRDTIQGPGGLGAALTLIEEKTRGSSTAYAEITGRVEALSFLNTMLGASLEDNIQLFQESGEAAGIAAQAFAEYGRTTPARVSALNAELETTQILLGTGAGASDIYGGALAALTTPLFRFNQLLRDNNAEEEVATRLRLEAAEALDRNRKMLEGRTDAERQAIISSEAYGANLAIIWRTRQLVGLVEGEARQNLLDLNQISEEGADVTNELTAALDGYLGSTKGLTASGERWNALAGAYGYTADEAGNLKTQQELLTEAMWASVTAAEEQLNAQLRLVNPQLNAIRQQEELEAASKAYDDVLKDTTASERDREEALLKLVAAQLEADTASDIAGETLSEFVNGPLQTALRAYGLTEEQIADLIEETDKYRNALNKLDGTRAVTSIVERRETMYVTSGTPPSGGGSGGGGSSGPPRNVSRVGPSSVSSVDALFYREETGGVSIEPGAIQVTVNVSGDVKPGQVSSAVDRSMNDAIARLARELAVS